MTTTTRAAKALERIRKLEADLADARRNLETEIVVASDAGVSYSKIGDALCLSKQRVGDLAKHGRARTPSTL